MLSRKKVPIKTLINSYLEVYAILKASIEKIRPTTLNESSFFNYFFFGNCGVNSFPHRGKRSLTAELLPKRNMSGLNRRSDLIKEATYTKRKTQTTRNKSLLY